MMTTYVLVEDERVTQVAIDDTNMSFDEWIARFPPSFTWVDVEGQAPQPEVGWSAIDDGGTWTFAPYVPPPPPGPTQEQIRATRNALLTLADFAINTTDDGGLSSSSLRAWRQQLRDVPAQPGFPASIAWPALPENIVLPETQRAQIDQMLAS